MNDTPDASPSPRTDRPTPDSPAAKGIDRTTFTLAVAMERHQQIAKGYTAEHDDEHGAGHLVNLAIEAIYTGHPVRAAAMVHALGDLVKRLEARS